MKERREDQTRGSLYGQRWAASAQGSMFVNIFVKGDALPSPSVPYIWISSCRDRLTEQTCRTDLHFQSASELIFTSILMTTLSRYG